MGIGEIIAAVLLAAFGVSYVLGWRRMRRALPTLATRLRLLAFAVALLALILALVWPLPVWSNYLLAMRSLQKVLVCMVAAPLLWLAAPVHLLVWRAPQGIRRAYLQFRHPTQARSIAQSTSQPLVAWFAYVAAFLFWHDPTLAHLLIGARAAHVIAPWLLLLAGLLFWWPIVDSGPRFHRGFPAWLLIVSLFSVEVANMVAGITIAFAQEPIYPHYVAVRAQLPPDALPWSQQIDQIAGGAIVWVFGSLVYISGIVFVLFRLFHKEGSTTPQPLPNWDDNAKFIAPGLEHRVAQNKLRNVDLSHH